MQRRARPATVGNDQRRLFAVCHAAVAAVAVVYVALLVCVATVLTLTS